MFECANCACNDIVMSMCMFAFGSQNKVDMN